MTKAAIVPAAVQAEIKRIYGAMRASGMIKNRAGQRVMIARVAATASAAEEGKGRKSTDRLEVIHAPTGLGKSLGYSIGAIPAAFAREMPVIIATSTVALQEQLADIDLPRLAAFIPNMAIAVAKGRRRYVCVAKLESHLRAADLPQEQHAKVIHWDKGLRSRQWAGDRDSLRDVPDAGLWAQVTTDANECTGKGCSSFDECPYFKARSKVETANVIVTNHDLLLTEALHESGALPELSRCVIVIDEAHDLPDVAMKMMETRHNVHQACHWTEHFQRLMAQITRSPFSSTVGEAASRSTNALRIFQSASENVRRCLEDEVAHELKTRRPTHERQTILQFAGGQLPIQIQRASADADEAAKLCAKTIDDLRQALAGPEASTLPKDVRDRWLNEVAPLSIKANAASSAWALFSAPPTVGLPVAKWLEVEAGTGQIEIHVNASPLLPDVGLYDALWSKCGAAILCSATIKTVGAFAPFLRDSGLALAGNVETVDLPSPFDYGRQGKMCIPRMRYTPKDPEHASEVAALLPQLLRQLPEGRGALLLFTSWLKLNAAFESLAPELAQYALKQGQFSKTEIIERHKAAIEAGRPSYIFGTASFEQGVDLPGHLCELVIIEKIPFAVPTHPVDVARVEWMRAQGIDHFAEMAVPEATKRLVQGTGRLIRTEQDRGTIVVLDSRLFTTRYGRNMLDALPPYPLERSSDIALAVA